MESTSKYYELPISWDSKQNQELKKLGIISKEDEIDFMVIDLNTITAFNPSYEINETTIRTNFGATFIVAIPYKEFKSFFIEKTFNKIIDYDN